MWYTDVRSRSPGLRRPAWVHTMCTDISWASFWRNLQNTYSWNSNRDLYFFTLLMGVASIWGRHLLHSIVHTYNKMYNYKQVRPSAELASLRPLRPAYSRPQCAQCCWDVCHYGQCYRIGTAKVQRFIGKGISQIVYADGKIRQSTHYAGRGQPLLHRLQSQGISG